MLVINFPTGRWVNLLHHYLSQFHQHCSRVMLIKVLIFKSPSSWNRIDFTLVTCIKISSIHDDILQIIIFFNSEKRKIMQYLFGLNRKIYLKFRVTYLKFIVQVLKILWQNNWFKKKSIYLMTFDFPLSIKKEKKYIFFCGILPIFFLTI